MKKIIILIFFLILSINFILAANCPPGIPKTYYGVVKYNGNLLSGNYEIRASIGTDDTIGISSIVNGYYSIDISPCYGTTVSTFSFYVGGKLANEHGSYAGQTDWGVEESLNLTINQLPTINTTCGNGVVESGEECDGTNLAGRDINNCGNGWTGTISCNSICEIDYSNCVLTNSGSSSSNGNGGSSGGSSSSSSSSSKSSTSSSTETSQPSNLSTGDNKINLENNGKSAPITGGVIGFAKSSAGIVTFSGLIILAALGVILLNVQKKMNRGKEGSEKKKE